MQMVIELDDKTYQKRVDHDLLTVADLNAFIVAISKGTPLPKGHGVLKDVTNLMRGLYTDMQTDEMMFTSSEVYKLIDEECPTIIPAEEVQDDQQGEI